MATSWAEAKPPSMANRADRAAIIILSRPRDRQVDQAVRRPTAPRMPAPFSTPVQPIWVALEAQAVPAVAPAAVAEGEMAARETRTLFSTLRAVEVRVVQVVLRGEVPEMAGLAARAMPARVFSWLALVRR
jgi:hypothetical protein